MIEILKIIDWHKGEEEEEKEAEREVDFSFDPSG